MSTWFFARALSLIYLIAFLSLFVQAKGLWGLHGVMPIRPFMQAVSENLHGRSPLLRMPSVFWLSTSDDFIVGAAITGAVAAGVALLGFAEGWSLLFCYVLYLSFCVSGQEFMSFQWDSLLLEVGFLALFMVPWKFDFTLGLAREPHWLVRGMFYLVLFKLMFLSGAVKLLSGDESWRDLTALNYHYFTQPLPNPLAPFFHELPEWMHQLMAGITFAIELVLPFLIFWPRARLWAAMGFGVLSVSILISGNFAFFNWLTIALSLWLIPDDIWLRLAPRLSSWLQVERAAMFPHPVISIGMAILATVSLFWCARFWLPEPVMGVISPILQIAETFRLSNSYGLFAVMTKTRPEIVIEGSLDGQVWKEYEFRYKPSNLYHRPPLVAPYQPRLDWQMWFAALGHRSENPWIETLMQRLFENSKEVLALIGENPFGEAAPQFLRARLYSYEFAPSEQILNNDQWWTRKPLGDYTPTYTKP